MVGNRRSKKERNPREDERMTQRGERRSKVERKTRQTTESDKAVETLL